VYYSKEYGANTQHKHLSRVLKKSFKGSPKEEEHSTVLWVQYHHMVNVIKICNRIETVADYNGHIFCTAKSVLDIFLDADHHQYAQVYFQLMKQLEVYLYTRLSM